MIIFTDVMNPRTLVVSSLLLVSLASVFSFTSTKVRLHEAATLPCQQKCSGLVTWARATNNADILAQCNQTSCQSKEGFQMLRDQYLIGNLSLIITEADFTKRDWYICKCDGKIICDVSLRLEPFSYPVHVPVGESLTLDLPISDDIEVTISKGDGPNTRLCTIMGRKAQCDLKYEKRVSLNSSLQLKEVKNFNIKNDEVIGMYTVTVDGTKADRDELPGEGKPPSHQTSVGTSLAAVFLVLLLFAIAAIVVLSVKNQKLQKSLRQMQDQPISLQHVEPRGQVEGENVDEVPVSNPVMETEDGLFIMEQKEMQQDSENEAGPEEDPLLETDFTGRPSSVTDESQLPYPVLVSCLEYPGISQTQAF